MHDHSTLMCADLVNGCGYKWGCFSPSPLAGFASSLELARIVRRPDVQTCFTSQGRGAIGSTPEDMAMLIKNELVLYAKLVKQLGLQPQ